MHSVTQWPNNELHPQRIWTLTAFQWSHATYCNAHIFWVTSLRFIYKSKINSWEILYKWFEEENFSTAMWTRLNLFISYYWNRIASSKWCSRYLLQQLLLAHQKTSNSRLTLATWSKCYTVNSDESPVLTAYTTHFINLILVILIQMD